MCAREIPSGFRSRRTAPLLAHLFLLLLLTGSASGTYAGPDRAAPVASVAGLEISEEAFRDSYVQYLLSTGLNDTPTLRARFLQRMVEDRLLAQEALHSGVTSRPEYQIAEERHRRKLLIDLYVRRTVYDTIQVTEADLEEAFRRVNTSIKARHLYARTRDEADQLYARLLAGASFEALARETFSDSVLAASGGSLGWFTFDEMDPAFEDAAFSLDVGEIAPPVRTAQGYSIIQVENRVVEPLLTESAFASRRDDLATYVINRKRVTGRRSHVRALTDALDLSFEQPALDDLHRQITGQIVAPDDEAFSEWLSRPLLHFSDEGRRITWTIDRFRREAGFTEPGQRAQVRSLHDLHDFIEGIVAREVMLARARDAGLDAHPDVPAALDEAMTGWLAAAARARITSDLPSDEASQALAARINELRHRFSVEVRLDQLNAIALVAE